jgi:hypothetical protein
MERPDKSSRKALLKAWKEGEHQKARARFPLDDPALASFFDALELLTDSAGCFHDTRHAQHVIDDLALSDDSANALLDWCCETGGFCDCEIVLNTYGHWQGSRDRPD